MRKTAGLIAAVGLSLCAGATPAFASYGLPAGCHAYDGSHGTHKISAKAWYSYNASTQQHYWSGSAWTLTSTGTSLGNKNNVNIFVYQNSGLVATRTSDDDIRPNLAYTSNTYQKLYIGAYTSEIFAEWVTFVAIFDTSSLPDKQCPGRTAKL